jgi:hypothetical protein
MNVAQATLRWAAYFRLLDANSDAIVTQAEIDAFFGGVSVPAGSTCHHKRDNVARFGVATQSSDYPGDSVRVASKGNDGNFNSASNDVFHTDACPCWWEVELTKTYAIDYIEI